MSKVGQMHEVNPDPVKSWTEGFAKGWEDALEAAAKVSADQAVDCRKVAAANGSATETFAASIADEITDTIRALSKKEG